MLAITPAADVLVLESTAGSSAWSGVTMVDSLALVVGSLGAGGWKFGNARVKYEWSLPNIQIRSSKSSVWKMTPLRGTAKRTTVTMVPTNAEGGTARSARDERSVRKICSEG
jgi:hypothetical protein